ncbi:MAG: hypothetical protein CBB97_25010 [Candidatus Endolissoclinum sp. TMED37]|nr:MAG: hypothetical protein CBB97_25010 [Candidatus Endolissoclinum sp. TMED37]|tara:strand:- start:103 stop:1728 length:1626 start_codon:yes stop_codon:yes gene_type:complete
MAIDYLQALNIGSGLNTGDIIDALVEAERAPQASQITKHEEQRTVEISSLGEVKQGFETLQTSLASYTGITGLQTNQSGNSLDIEITDASAASEFSNSIEISALAAGQTLVFGSFDSETASVGSGSLAFSFGTWNGDGSFTANGDRSDETVALDSDNDTLAGLRNTINNSDIGVTASILKTDDDNYALVLQAREGVAHAMQITATEDADNSGLANFDYTAVDTSIQKVAASDAAFTLDGIDISRETNEVADLVNGVTLTLKATTSSAETIGASFDTTLASATMSLIVDEMNSLMADLSTLLARGSNGEAGGPLAGDALVRSLQRQMQAMSSTAIIGFQDESVYMADYGVETNRDGSLSFNVDTFQTAFEANPDGFAAITNSRITSSSNMVTPSVAGTHPEAGIYAFNLAADSSATLDGEAMTRDGSAYTITDSDVGGLKLTLVGSGSDASIYVGKSILETLDDFSTNVLRINSELDQKIERYEDDVATYQDDMSALDERIADLRARYAVQFGAMESAVNSLKNTEAAIDSMMEAWKASLNN